MNANLRSKLQRELDAEQREGSTIQDPSLRSGSIQPNKLLPATYGLIEIASPLLPSSRQVGDSQ